MTHQGYQLFRTEREDLVICPADYDLTTGVTDEDLCHDHAFQAVDLEDAILSAEADEGEWEEVLDNSRLAVKFEDAVLTVSGSLVNLFDEEVIPALGWDFCDSGADEPVPGKPGLIWHKYRRID
jgi:hypothetical protein